MLFTRVLHVTTFLWLWLNAGNHGVLFTRIYVFAFCAGNLKCRASDSVYFANPSFNIDEILTNVSCTYLVQSREGHLGYVYPPDTNIVDGVCKWNVIRPADGHRFVQGIDGKISTDKFQLVVTYCSRNEYATFLRYAMCCPSKLTEDD